MSYNAILNDRARWPRLARVNQILDIITRSKMPLTRRQISNRAGLAPTAYTINIIEELVTNGEVRKIEATAPNGVIMYLYEAA